MSDNGDGDADPSASHAGANRPAEGARAAAGEQQQQPPAAAAEVTCGAAAVLPPPQPVARSVIKSAIEKLKEEQRKLADEKKSVNKDLRNMQRRKKRLRVKVQNLTDEDLVEVLRQRSESKAAKVCTESPSPRAKASDQSADLSTSAGSSPAPGSLASRMGDTP